MSNQYCIVAPDSINVDEFSPFNYSFSVTYAPPAEITDPYNYSIHDFVYDSRVSQSAVTFTKTGAMSFTMSGVISDVFARQLKYRTTDLGYGEATKFSELPADYGGLYSFTNGGGQMILEFSVRLKDNTLALWNINATNLHSYPLKVIVRNNWQTATQYFTTAVQNGAWAKNANI
jgi:hypothetical protein